MREVEAAAVVHDVEAYRVIGAREGHHDPAGPGVLPDIGQGALGDAEQSHLDGGGQ